MDVSIRVGLDDEIMLLLNQQELELTLKEFTTLSDSVETANNILYWETNSLYDSETPNEIQ